MTAAAAGNIVQRASGLGAIIQSTPGMAEVEELMREKCGSEVPLLTDIPSYLMLQGGKRIRPLLALITASSLGVECPTQALIDVAAGIELIHMATLLHDDIIDKSPLRRHKESAFLKYGLEPTLLAGDFLLVRAFSLCARLDDFIVKSTENACVWLTEGELLETAIPLREHTLETSCTIARKKTAALFRLAAESGAHLATKNARITELLGRYGEDLGIAFQLIDDVLDVTADESLLGKPAGTDIRERKPSIVNILWLSSGDAEAKKLLDPSIPMEERWVHSMVARLKSSPIISESKALAKRYIASAQSSLMEATRLSGRDEEDFAPLCLLLELATSRGA